MATPPRWVECAGCWLALVLSTAAAAAQPAIAEMQPPVRPLCLTSPFGIRPAPGADAPGFHNGIDLRAASGAYVYAVAEGNIVTIHRRGPGGLELAIAHQGSLGRYVSLYAHLGQILPAFAQGRTHVKAGERIARIGRTGVTYGTHLYFELLVDGKPVDPAPLFPVQPCARRGDP